MSHLDLQQYELFAIAFSGGKDSICCLLSLLEAGVDPARIELHQHLVAHPAYFLGWGRLSCQRCIFGSPHQWASNYAIAPQQTELMHQYEREFDHTLDNKFSIPQLAAKGTPYPSLEPDFVNLALNRIYTGPVRVQQQDWSLPTGAYGENSGPS